ncbi:phosphoribosylaminoimidazolesuccinocarboxamide synthase [Marinifilum fragile]
MKFEAYFSVTNSTNVLLYNFRFPYIRNKLKITIGLWLLVKIKPFYKLFEFFGAMKEAIVKTDFNFPNQKNVYKGKVRDVYNINDEYLAMVVSDRISAFDVVLPKGIPFKGQVLNQIAERFLDATADIVPNWKIATPDPMVTIGHLAEPFMVEMVIRGYLTGHAWREYKAGKRTLCGVPLPEGMVENQKFEKPIITPTTKALEGHDEDISREEILEKGIVSKEDYEMLEKYTMALFQRGTEIAAEKGLILVDTKYEFGKKDGKIYLIDEIHTPDSSRYFYTEGYEERLANGEAQKQLSKEFVREWLMENGFQGKEGQVVPEMDEERINQISERYIELYEQIIGEKFVKAEATGVKDRIEKNIAACLKEI